jgi:hypothetical protein
VIFLTENVEHIHQRRARSAKNNSAVAAGGRNSKILLFV